jgi:hypothetical protein
VCKKKEKVRIKLKQQQVDGGISVFLSGQSKNKHLGFFKLAIKTEKIKKIVALYI